MSACLFIEFASEPRRYPNNEHVQKKIPDSLLVSTDTSQLKQRKKGKSVVVPPLVRRRSRREEVSADNEEETSKSVPSTPLREASYSPKRGSRMFNNVKELHGRWSRSSNHVKDEVKCDDDEDEIPTEGTSPISVLLSTRRLPLLCKSLRPGPCEDQDTMPVFLRKDEPIELVSSQVNANATEQRDSEEKIQNVNIDEQIVQTDYPNTGRSVSFSSTEVITHEVEYCPFHVDKSFPLTLGGTVLDRKTYTVDLFENDHRKRHNFTKVVKMKQETTSNDGEVPDPTANATPATTTPATAKIGKTNRARRISSKARRNRLLQMGYTNAELDILDVRRNVHQIMRHQQLSQQ